MPLTISHPAAAIPLRKMGLILSALIIGSLTPDIPYFFPIYPNSSFSHSLIGLVAYCLPAGLILLGIFHFVIKLPILALLPNMHQRRLYYFAKSFSLFPPKHFLLIIISILFGALTHLAWDAFTHPKAWGVEQFPILKTQINFLGLLRFPVYKFLQHGSTFLGGALLVYWYIKWYQHAKTSHLPDHFNFSVSTKIIIFTAISLVSFFVALYSGVVNIPAFYEPVHYDIFAAQVFIVGVSTFSSLLVAFSIYWHLFIHHSKFNIPNS
jgi:hypothetical protein